MTYRMLLDQAASEAIIAPFHDPEHSHWISVGVDCDTGQALTRETLWDSTAFYWSLAHQHLECTLRVVCDVDLDDFDKIVVCAAAPKEATIQFALLGSDLFPLGKWSAPVAGIGQREEYLVSTSALIPARLKVRPSKLRELVKGVAIKILCPGTQTAVFSLNWIGLRNSATNRLLAQRRAGAPVDWTPWILPESHWGEFRFERGLMFGTADLERVRAKLSDPAWKAHFSLLESRAQQYLQRVPEDDLSDYLPNHDARYIRKSQKGKTCYHWEALVLGFVGLVNRDNALIHHALRYLMCMVHTPFWTESAEHNLASSTWSHRSFLEEMTTTSVAILYDWLGFALFPRTKALILKALSERGMVKVARDLSSRPQMHEMNQGAVFNRALILGGLMLESGWPKYSTHAVDDAYRSMVDVLGRYVKQDGGVHEGIGYLCQTMTATIWATIAYARARGLDWRVEVLKLYEATPRYVAAMAASQPGKAIPAGDCRVEWFGGDAIPVMADLLPDSAFSMILGACLVEGTVHELTGTLAKSGGLIGMVYGPDVVAASSAPVPAFDLLPDSSKATLSETSASGLTARVWVSGATGGGAHAHRDVGEFVLEIGDIPVFVDRGMVQYWHTEAHLLSRAWLHNVVTPVKSDGDFAEQAWPNGTGVLEGSAEERLVLVPGNGIWRDHGIIESHRRFQFHHPGRLAIDDHLSLTRRLKVAFHLHSPYPFKVNGNVARLEEGGTRVSVLFPWAERVTCSRLLGDFASRPVFHICAYSSNLDDEVSLRSEIDFGALDN